MTFAGKHNRANLASGFDLIHPLSRTLSQVIPTSNRMQVPESELLKWFPCTFVVRVPMPAEGSQLATVRSRALRQLRSERDAPSRVDS